MQIELVAKTLIVNSANEVLVLRRHDNDDYRPGQWDLPGGQVDASEDPQDGAIREAQEETGLTLTNLRIVHVASRIHDDRQIVKTVFMTTAYDGILKLSFEHSEARWIPIAELNRVALSDDYKHAARLLLQDQLAV
jgi:8-oxo-dGTP pyrophosphatase MutT (NUDIX family)